MSKKLIFQINVPNHIQTSKLTTYTFMKDMYEISERNARRYAERCGADYYKLSDANDFAPAAGKHLDYQKLKAYDFKDFDQIVYFDSDYIIKENAPDLFLLCGNKFSASIDAGKSASRLAEELGIPAHRYFNAGLMYLTKEVLDSTRDCLAEYLKNEYPFDGQGLLNKMFYDKGINFNPLAAHQWNPVGITFGDYADHYAGKKKQRWGRCSY
jgi:lipopolysaccharide biosynthesis glycosyltransferase